LEQASITFIYLKGLKVPTEETTKIIVFSLITFYFCKELNKFIVPMVFTFINVASQEEFEFVCYSLVFVPTAAFRISVDIGTFSDFKLEVKEEIES